MRKVVHVRNSSDIEIRITLGELKILLAGQADTSASLQKEIDRNMAFFDEYRSTGKVVEWDEAIQELS